MAARSVLNVLVVLLVAGSVLALTPIGVGPLRVVLGVLLVLVIPGLFVTSAVFPGRLFGVPERVALTLGTSLVVIALGGQLLNLTATGLHAVSWVILILAVVAVAVASRRLRDRKAVAGWLRIDRSTIHAVRGASRQLVLVAAAAVLVLAAFVVSRAGAEATATPGFTELWMRPTGTDAASVELGVRSAELSDAEYRLELRAQGEFRDDWTFVLAPGQEWRTTFELPADLASERIDAELYRADRPDEVYRQVVLWSRQAGS